MRTGYVDFLKRIANHYAINRVVHIGDLVDWASISYHEKSPSLRNATLEYARAKRQVASLTKAFPKADWLIWNHDALLVYLLNCSATTATCGTSIGPSTSGSPSCGSMA